MEFLDLIQKIDPIFSFVLLIGGRYWGTKYVRIFKNPDNNFLLFAKTKQNGVQFYFFLKVLDF